MDHFGPDAVRALRGPLTPAELAERLGVSELTVRRWELPDDHPEARRPRRASRARLRALRAPSSPVPRWVALADRARLAAARDAALAAGPEIDPARVRAVLALEALVGRGDVLAARAALVEPPPDGPVGTRLHALGALLYASRDGRVWDPERALAHAERARGDAEARALADVARVAVFEQTRRIEEAIGVAEAATGFGALTRCLCAEARARAALLRGRPEQASVLYRRVAERARGLGLALVEARARATRGLLSLVAAEDPADALAQAERARHVLRDGRVEPGAVEVDVAGAHAEALLRLGRVADALATVEAAELVAARIRWAADALVPARLRLWLHGRVALPFRSGGGPHGEVVDALLALVATFDEETAADRARSAARLAREARMPILEAWAAVLAETFGGPAGALDRLLDRVPMPWFDAIGAPARAAALTSGGRTREAVWALEAAIAVLERAADRPELARARLSLALLRGDATPAIAARAELAELGLEPIAAWFPPLGRVPGADGPGGPGLVHRVALRGVPPARIERELVTGVVRLLGPTGTVELVEEEPGGREWQLARRGPPEPRAPFFERTIGDGHGRRLRLRAGPVGPADRETLEAACVAAGLALELAASRTRPPPPDTDVARLAGSSDPVLVLAPADRDLSTLFVALHGDRPGALVVHGGPGLRDAMARAAGGTLVVRDLADLDTDAQAALARILRETEPPARIVAVSALPLAAVAAAGLLRPDLLHTLSAEVLLG